MKKDADWASWTMQFIIGMVVGAFLGVIPCLALSRYAARSSITTVDALYVICATSLAVAGLAAYKGDRLWFGKPSIFIPMGHKHSHLSKTLALLIAIAGFTLVVLIMLCIASRPPEPVL